MGDVELNLSLTDCKRCISQKHYAKLSRAMRAPWVDHFLNNEIYCYPLSKKRCRPPLRSPPVGRSEGIVTSGQQQRNVLLVWLHAFELTVRNRRTKLVRSENRPNFHSKPVSYAYCWKIKLVWLEWDTLILWVYMACFHLKLNQLWTVTVSLTGPIIAHCLRGWYNWTVFCLLRWDKVALTGVNDSKV